jgi:hypothetical protein
VVRREGVAEVVIFERNSSSGKHRGEVTQVFERLVAKYQD